MSNIILFITANENERIAFLVRLENQSTKTFSHGVVCKFGDFGKYKVVHYHSPKQGNDAELEILRAVGAVNPDYVILVGVACGGNNKKQKIGDVLISHNVIDYDCRKEDYNLKTNVETTIWRGARIPSGDVIYRLFNGHYFDWQVQNNVKAHLGDIICSSELLNNPFKKAKVFAVFHNEPVGYEMEGASAFRACRYAKITEWILIKGVCDFGDGNKGKNKRKYQEIAAKNAVSLCHYVFSQGDNLFGEIPKATLKYSNLPPVTPNFTGRNDYLEMIQKMFTENGCVSLTQAPTITGMGGIGKTSIALEYSHQHFEDYTYVWWINAETSESLQKSFNKFVRIVCGGESYRHLDELKAFVHRWLIHHSNWLLIFDNAENIQELNGYLPGHYKNGCNVLITSRNKEWPNSIQINLYTENEALKYFIKVTKLAEDDSAKELCKELGFLPLAVAQAAAYIKNNVGETYCSYLKLYREFSLDVLDEESNDECNSVRITFDISKYRLSESAKEMLFICSMLPPDSIELKWFFQISSSLPTELANALSNELTYRRLKRELTAYSFVGIEDDKMTIHRLLQKVIKESKIKLSSRIFYEMAMCMQKEHHGLYEITDETISIIECLKYCAKVAFIEFSDKEYADILFRIACACYTNNDSECLKYCRMVLEYSLAFDTELQNNYRQRVYGLIETTLSDTDLYYISMELCVKCINIGIEKVLEKHVDSSLTEDDLHYLITSIIKAKGFFVNEWALNNFYSVYPSEWDSILKKDIDDIIDDCGNLSANIHEYLLGCLIFDPETHDRDDISTEDEEILKNKGDTILLGLLSDVILKRNDSIVPYFQNNNLNLPVDYDFEDVQQELTELLNPQLIRGRHDSNIKYTN